MAVTNRNANVRADEAGTSLTPSPVTAQISVVLIAERTRYLSLCDAGEDGNVFHGASKVASSPILPSFEQVKNLRKIVSEAEFATDRRRQYRRDRQ